MINYVDMIYFMCLKKINFLNENEMWLYVICEKSVKDGNSMVKWGYTLNTYKMDKLVAIQRLSGGIHLANSSG